LLKTKKSPKRIRNDKTFDFWNVWEILLVKRELVVRLKVKTPKGKKEKVSKIIPAKIAGLRPKFSLSKKIKRKRKIK